MDREQLTQSDFFEIHRNNEHVQDRPSTITPRFNSAILKDHMNYSMVRVFKNYMRDREDIYGLTKYRKECLRYDEEYEPVFSEPELEEETEIESD